MKRKKVDLEKIIKSNNINTIILINADYSCSVLCKLLYLLLLKLFRAAFASSANLIDAIVMNVNEIIDLIIDYFDLNV